MRSHFWQKLGTIREPAVLGVGLLFIAVLYILGEQKIGFTLLTIQLVVLLYPLAVKDRNIVSIFMLVMIPLEISKLWVPFLQIVEGREGLVSVLDFSRISILIAGIYWLVLDFKRSRLEIRLDGAVISLILFLCWAALSLGIGGNGGTRGVIELSRYISYLVMLWIFINFTWSSRDIEKLFMVFIYLGIVLSFIGIFEFITNIHLWNQMMDMRANTTFADPNIFARFLAIALTITFYFRSKGIYGHPVLLDSAMILMGVTLLFTISRGGIVALAGSMFIVFLYADKKTRRTLTALGVFFSAIVVVSIADMVGSRGGDISVADIGGRAALILTGVTMFLSHPIAGVGLGGFQEVALTSYIHLLPWDGTNDSLSHTTVITVLAELGIVGILLLINIIWQVLRVYKYIITNGSERIRDLAILTLAILTVLFVSSQSAGRLFEDPYTWFGVAMLSVLLRLVKLEEKSKRHNILTEAIE